MLNLFNTLKEAFETSTQNCNKFKQSLDSIIWDNTFFADEEYYFIKDGFTFSTPSLNPFEISQNWMPSAIFADGSYMEFC